MKEGFSQLITVTVVVTWICAYFDGSAPYFPIEISRTACGRLSRWPLLVGASAAYACVETWPETISWAGLFLLAAVTDTMSWGVHMLGVAIMAAGAAIQFRHEAAFLIAVGGLFAARVVAKFIVVWWAELGGELDVGKIALTVRNVMLSGKASHTTLTIMKLTGMIQWGCFWAIINLYS